MRFQQTGSTLWCRLQLRLGDVPPAISVVEVLKIDEQPLIETTAGLRGWSAAELHLSGLHLSRLHLLHLPKDGIVLRMIKKLLLRRLLGLQDRLRQSLWLSLLLSLRQKRQLLQGWATHWEIQVLSRLIRRLKAQWRKRRLKKPKLALVKKQQQNIKKKLRWKRRNTQLTQNSYLKLKVSMLRAFLVVWTNKLKIKQKVVLAQTRLWRKWRKSKNNVKRLRKTSRLSLMIMTEQSKKELKISKELSSPKHSLETLENYEKSAWS